MYRDAYMYICITVVIKEEEAMDIKREGEGHEWEKR